MTVLATTTLSAGWCSVTDLFLPMTQKPELAQKGWFNTGLTILMMACVVTILADSALRWRGRLLRPAVLGSPA